MILNGSRRRRSSRSISGSRRSICELLDSRSIAGSERYPGFLKRPSYCLLGRPELLPNFFAGHRTRRYFGIVDGTPLADGDRNMRSILPGQFVGERTAPPEMLG